VVDYDTFSKLDLRIGLVEAAERVLRAITHKAFGGFRFFRKTHHCGWHSLKYEPEDLVGKRIVVVANLQPRKLMGVLSTVCFWQPQEKMGYPTCSAWMGSLNPGLK